MTPTKDQFENFAKANPGYTRSFYGYQIYGPRELTHNMYRESGFDVDMGGVWRSQPHINVQFTTASVESDFYEYD